MNQRKRFMNNKNLSVSNKCLFSEDHKRQGTFNLLICLS